MAASDPVIVVGGGITGLTAAYYLSQSRIPNILIEREPRLGGIMQTEYAHGCVLEAGPDSFLTAKPWTFELLRDLGLAGEVIGSNDHLRATWIWRDNRFVQMPEGMTMMAPSRIGPILGTSLLSWHAKVRMGLEYFRRPVRNQRDRTVAEFVEDHYGREVVDYLAEPLLSGVFGGSPGELSAASVLPKMFEWEAKYGSLGRGARRELRDTGVPLFSTMRNGLAQLRDAVIQKLDSRVVHGNVERIEKGYRVRVNGEWIGAGHVIVACRPDTVLPGLFPKFHYNPATVVALVYNRADIPHSMNGFGFLVPRRERRSLAACTWVGTKFHHRVAEGKAVLRCFVTGSLDDVAFELREKMGISAEPLVRRVHHWPESMPQYQVGHADTVRVIEEMLKDLPGLHVAGNAYYGVGIPDCIRMAKEVADRIRNQMGAG